MAYELGERLLALAESADDPGLLGQSHIVLGTSSFYLGELGRARTHLDRGVACFDLENHCADAFLLGQDPLVHGLIASGRALWFLGYPDQARKRMQEALALARKLSHPYSLALGLTLAAELHQCRRETERTLEYAEAAITLSTEQGFPLWLAWATILRGWALGQQGRAEEGIAQMREGLIAYRATGAELARPYQLAPLAQACGNAGQAEAGLETLREALNVADRKGERYYVAELHRLRGELLQQRSGAQSRYLADHEAAQACFRDAIAIARQQGAPGRSSCVRRRVWLDCASARPTGAPPGKR
ncbi:hypothetical protein VSR68_38960 [Paraburkholderia phymatum]|uniref:hypothetical protein n=1 Tax=Paraburkholderia phymatum TaxID=148447 RepID=UPI00316DB4D3